LGLKVLDENMQSCNGGTMAWALDKWVSVKGTISICSRGLHMTYDLSGWKGNRVFIGETAKIFEKEGDKVVCGRMRLLRELTPAEVKRYEEAIAPEVKRYEEAIAPEVKRYEEAAAAEYKRHEEATAAEDKRHNEAIQVVLAAMLEAPKQ
jgi:hypothetical protein